MTMKKAAALAFVAVFAGVAIQATVAQAATAVIKSDFESGADGWGGRGNPDALETVAVSGEEKHGGAASLKVSDRKTTWHGPVRVLGDELKSGAVYDVSAWIKYVDGPAVASFTASAEFDGKSGSRAYRNLSSANVPKGEWTKIEAVLTVPDDKDLDKILVYFETRYKADNQITPDDTVDFYLDDVLVVKRTKVIAIQEDLPSLREVLAGKFDLGTAVSPELLDAYNPHRRLITKHFGALVAGNAMKPDALQPKEGEFTFAAADKIADFGEKTGMRVRGHTLVWHNQIPAWFFTDPEDPTKPASKAQLLAREEKHIKTVVEHFQGRVESWDVVNEVIDDTGKLRDDAGGSKWLGIAGKEYIEKAFIWAHEADPKAQLVINDYNLESNPAKRQATYELVKELLAKKIPVHAVGLQMHISINYPRIEEIRKTIELFASLGVKVLVTEMDVSIYESESAPYMAPSTDILLAQADRYRDLFAVFKEAAAKGVLDIVVLWGSADDDTWLDDFPVAGRKNAPLLFDRDLQAKPAYWAIADL